jgi:hypothetical protein
LETLPKPFLYKGFWIPKNFAEKRKSILEKFLEKFEKPFYKKVFQVNVLERHGNLLLKGFPHFFLTTDGRPYGDLPFLKLFKKQLT